MKRKELKRAAAGLMAVSLCMGLTAFPVFAGGTEIGRSVTVVEDGGKRTVLGLDEKGEGSGWSYGGNMVLTRGYTLTITAFMMKTGLFLREAGIWRSQTRPHPWEVRENIFLDRTVSLP